MAPHSADCSIPFQSNLILGFISVCIFFVFLELCEFTLVIHLNQKQKKDLVRKVEICSRIIFPILFLLFNFNYWPYLLASHLSYF